MGVPDESAVPSAHLNYQSVFTLQPQAAATGTWSFKLALLPHPVNLLWYSTTDTVGTAVGNSMNTQLPGTTHIDKMASFLGVARRWRLTYMSATIYQDGADLTNQGTLVATQAPLMPAMYNIAGNDLFNHEGGAGGHAEAYLTIDRPDFTNMQSFPNAYFNRSREGCYIPLKLTRTHQNWRGIESLVGELAHTADDILATGNAIIPLPGTAAFSVFPHTNIAGPMEIAAGGTAGAFTCQVTSPLCNDVSGYVAAQNLAVTTRFSVYVRMGLEIQVMPGSLYTTHLKLSPQYDPVALESYFRIARELKDAYPADFNDLGKIWDVISGAAKAVAPFLSAIPVVGPALSVGVPIAASVGDRIREAISGPVASSSRQASATTSASQMQAARAVQSAVDADIFRGISNMPRVPPRYSGERRQRRPKVRRQRK